MVKSQHLVPYTYYRNSRDFQYFGRIYDIIFNYVKTNVDTMENFPLTESTDSKLIELLVRTLGFKNKRNYQTQDLVKIASVFMSLIKNKGTRNSIEKLVNTILNAEGIRESSSIIYASSESQQQIPGIEEITIIIPDDIEKSEIALLEDVLDYIIPVSVLYQIKSGKQEEAPEGQITVQDYVDQEIIVPNSNRTITYSDMRDMTLESGSTVGQQIAQPQNVIGGDISYTKLNPKENVESGE